jgi:uncharacterized OsmC-like protein
MTAPSAIPDAAPASVRAIPGDPALADPRAIAEIFERHARMLARTPARGMLTFATSARLVDGLRCEITDGPWRLSTDMPSKIGGTDSAPSPGMLGRGALAGCLAIGISRWAAHLGVPLEALEVKVEADLDARGELGAVDGVRPGYSEVRYTISLRSTAPHDRIATLLATAERHSPYLDIFGRPVALRGAHRINGEGA